MRDRRALLLGLPTLTSCAPPSVPVDTRQGDLIRIGMPEAEVTQRLGPPGMVFEQPRRLVQVTTPNGLACREKYRYTYYYPDTPQQRAMRIIFEDGVMVATSTGTR